MAGTGRTAKLAESLAAMVLLAGCGMARETLPDRSAMEQMLISTATDRAVVKASVLELEGKSVFIDSTNLECYDKPYVMQRIRRAILLNGGRPVNTREEAEIVLEVASGALSINKREYLLGVPSIPLPIPFVGTVETPEIPILKAVFNLGRAKLIFNPVDPATNSQLYEVPVCYGKSLNSYWWVLLFGPFEFSDLPKEAR